MSKTITTEVVEEKEQATPEPENKESEIRAEQAGEKAEEAEESEEKAESKAEEASQAAKAAEESKQQTEKLTSYNEYVVKGLTDSLQLVVTRVEQIANLNKTLMEDFRDVIEELRTTLELNQEQIAQVDNAAQKNLAATAALVRLHKEQAPTE